MIISLTAIRLKSVWKFFSLSYMGFKISQQAKTQRGFVKMKNTGLGYRHYTLSVWESEDALKEFAYTGAHLEAMKASQQLAYEIRTYTYKTEKIPSWKEAKELLAEKGKILLFK